MMDFENKQEYYDWLLQNGLEDSALHYADFMDEMKYKEENRPKRYLVQFKKIVTGHIIVDATDISELKHKLDVKGADCREITDDETYFFDKIFVKDGQSYQSIKGGKK